ncbi:WD40-repeat-containing domain protein [Entophlyctis helioformis]|nr:WD40-repeat-containing domain protein [Entophlyctis helioformis]
MSLEIESADVVRLILQFLKENNLLRSLATLQDETNVSFNTVDNADAFKADICAGRWDAVLKTLSALSVSPKKLVDLYEQIILELIEQRELVAARSLLRQTDPSQILKDIYPDRYLHLEALLSRTFFDPNEAYPTGTTKEKRRKAIADALCVEVAAVPPSRLMTIIGQSIKWQTSQGIIKADTEFDLFKGSAPAVQVEEDALPAQSIATIKFPRKQHAEVAVFSPDGQFLVTGTVDGLIEVWNYTTGKLRKDLKYQAEDAMMLMDSAVLSLAFNRDSDLLASGSQDGKITVWKIHTGQVLRRFPTAHNQGVTSLCFSRDGSQVLSASFDTTIRLHGLKSGKTLKEFRGHTSFVNKAIFSADGGRVISGSSDGTVKIWDTKSADCLTTIGLYEGKVAPLGAQSPTITALALTPKNDNHILVSNQSPFLYIISLKGQVVKSMTVEDAKPPDMTSAVVSSKGEFVYGSAENGRVYVFGTLSGKPVTSLPVSKTEIIGLAHHPASNILAVYADDGLVHIWK